MAAAGPMSALPSCRRCWMGKAGALARIVALAAFGGRRTSGPNSVREGEREGEREGGRERGREGEQLLQSLVR